MCIISTFNIKHSAIKTSALTMVVSVLRVCVLRQRGPGLLVYLDGPNRPEEDLTQSNQMELQ